VSDTGSQSVIKLDNAGTSFRARRDFHLERGLLRWDLVSTSRNVWMGTQGGVAVVEMNNSGTVISGAAMRLRISAAGCGVRRERQCMDEHRPRPPCVFGTRSLTTLRS